MTTFTYSLPRSTLLVFSWSDSTAIKGTRTINVEVPSVIDDSSTHSLARAVTTRCVGAAVQSFTGHVKPLRFLFKFLMAESITLFPPKDWDDFLDHQFNKHLENDEVSYLYRIATWHEISNFYEELRRQGYLPKATVIPTAKIKGGCIDEVAPPMGYEIERLKSPETLEELLPKKFLIEKDLHLPEDKYLSGLRTSMENSSMAVLSACKSYWQTMRKCHKIGKALIRSVSTEEIEHVIRSEQYYRNGKHLADPRQKDGMTWFLAVARYYITKTNTLNSVSYLELGKIPFFKKIIHNKRTRPLLTKRLWEIAGDYAVKTATVHETLNRLLGFLSVRDCAAACAILASENPSFTPDSLANIKLYNKNDKIYIRAETDLRRTILSTSKPRAGARKVSKLPRLSTLIVINTMQCTRDLRQKLKLNKQPGWRWLFLVSTRRRIGPSSQIAKTIADYSGTSLFDVLSKELSDAGIDRSDFSLSKIRSTCGIVRFLNTGSLQAVADLLGNSVQTVRGRYVPAWLVAKWAIRLLRIMQQKLITVATAGKPWALDSTDFLKQEDFNAFICKMLIDAQSKSDPLSQIISKAFGNNINCGDDLLIAVTNRELALNLTPHTIAILYAYTETFSSSDIARLQAVTRTAISPQAVFDLSNMIKATADLTVSEISNVDAAVADKISGESLDQLKLAHLEASALVQNYKAIMLKSPDRILIQHISEQDGSN